MTNTISELLLPHPPGSPAILALDSSVQGQGLGADLLVFVLDVVVTAARRAGGRAVLVDAIDDEARGFYEHHDFERVPWGGRTAS